MQTLDSDFKEYCWPEVRKEIHQIELQLKDNKMWEQEGTSTQRYKEFEKKYGELLQIEEIIWRQKSKAVWLKEGDKNTKFFHGKANQRRKVNEIANLKDDHGAWWNDYENVERLLVNYFSDLFTCSEPEMMAQTCDVVQNRLTEADKNWCSQLYSDEEIEAAIKQMHPSKAPGPDGLPVLFYQRYWHIVGSDVKKLVKNILNNNSSPAHLNSTYIVLIPKGKNPKSPKDYRPISLCNVVMKIVTKTLANRLKVILPNVSDEEQSGFVQGRLITDNSLIAMECFHWLKKKGKGKKGLMAVKLDMSKAYDRIEWSFVQTFLQTMGVPENMVKVIMNCVSTVSYQILINGQPSKAFSPERGLRQGDPISPTSLSFVLIFYLV